MIVRIDAQEHDVEERVDLRPDESVEDIRRQIAAGFQPVSVIISRTVGMVVTCRSGRKRHYPNLICGHVGGGPKFTAQAVELTKLSPYDYAVKAIERHGVRIVRF